jgi:L-malate glycosyltransferase
MKLLILNYEYPPLGGGAANATAYLLKEFSENRNIEIHLITSSTKRFFINKIAKNITIHHLDIGKFNNLHYQSGKELIKYSFRAFFYAKKLEKLHHFDLVHAFFGIPCGFLAMFLDKPFVVSLRGSDVPFYNKRFKIADRLVFQHLSKIIWKRAAFVVANSSGLQKLALKTLPSRKILIIPNGVDTSEFNPRKGLQIDSKLKLISTGRLIERKGYVYLIEALQNNETFHLTLLGDGNLKEELERKARESNVLVKFIGMVRHGEIADYLRGSDIFILPSLNEGMSNSVLEAMACGLPVIVTETGGSKELIKGNGFVVEKGSSDAIRQALLTYVDNKQLIIEHGVQSRILAEGMEWKQIARQYFEIYQRLV